MENRYSSLMAAIVLSTPPAAYAGSLTGNYNLTFNQIHPKMTPLIYCMSLTDNGSVLGYAHSGPLLLGGELSGEFFVAGDVFIATASYEGNDLVVTGEVDGRRLKSGASVGVLSGAPQYGTHVSFGALGSCQRPRPTRTENE